MTTKAVAKRLRLRIEKMKERIIAMKDQADEAGLDELGNQLASTHVLMDEAIGAAEDAEENGLANCAKES